MQKMKYSGVEWIDEIPEDWDIKRLKAVLCERNESNNPIKTDYILSLTNDRGVIPYDEKGDVGNKSKEDLSGYKLAYLNDIVLNSMNVIIGSVALSKYYGCVSPVYYMLYPRNPMDDVRYYNYIFQTKEFQSKLKGYGNGIMEIRMRIQMSKLNTVELPTPDATTQTRIADFLDDKCGKIDRYIEKQQQIIDKLKEYKQAVITEAVTKGLNPEVPMKDSGIEWIGMIPEHWGIRRLRYLGTCINGISKGGEYFGSGYPFVSYGDVYKNMELPSSVAGLVETTEDEREWYSVKEGDVFFTRTSETIEEVALTSTCMKTIENATFAGFLIRFRPNTNLLTKGFSKYYFRSDKHRLFFVKEMNLVTRASLSQELLKRLPVLLPTIDEQLTIAAYLEQKCSNIDKAINKKYSVIEKLIKYKKSLIYEAVTGKLEV